MNVLTLAMQQEYERHDTIGALLNATAHANDEPFTSHRWLRQTLPKRLIFERMYGDLLAEGATRQRVLDVGGGYTSLTRVLLARQDYHLLDIMAHDPHPPLEALEQELGTPFWLRDDWYLHQPNFYDIVVANDIFPNVDQRLQAFLDKYLPVCREVRLSLTYYNVPRWYKVKRVDADEIFHMLAWDGGQLRHVLEAYRERLTTPDFAVLQQPNQSLYANQRQICLVNVRGDR